METYGQLMVPLTQGSCSQEVGVRPVSRSHTIGRTHELNEKPGIPTIYGQKSQISPFVLI